MDGEALENAVRKLEHLLSGVDATTGQLYRQLSEVFEVIEIARALCAQSEIEKETPGDQS